MRLIVGLGNPGNEHAHNRHNIGFMAVDEIVRRHNFPAFRSKHLGEMTEGTINGTKVLILKPMTYMNDSGRSVHAAMSFYKIHPEDVFVFHDELDLAAGRIRVKRGGGHAGHNGLRSIHSHIGPDYARVRLGIGHPGDKGKVTGHVLKDFAKADEAWLNPLLAALADRLPLLVADDDAGFMNNVALDAPVPKAPRNKDEKADTPDGI